MHRLNAFLALVALAAPAGAIVTRHDLADSDYLSNPADFPFLWPLFRTKDGYGDCVATLIAP